MHGSKRFLVAMLAAALLAAMVQPASARIKLATLPARERVEIQLENENATLVEEERIVTLLKGTNHIDFSWTNTQIDKWTILFRPLVAGDTVRVINQSYPPGENALVWEVFADNAGPVRVRISYIVGNLRRNFSYRATAEADESALTLRHYMRVNNFSGEEFGMAGVYAGFAGVFQKEMGLAEAKEVLVAKFDKVPIRKKFVFNWRTGQPVPDEPNQRYVTMHYVLKNVKPPGAAAPAAAAGARAEAPVVLGTYPLPFGKVRIFLKDKAVPPNEAFLGEDWGQFTPIDDEMKLFLGLARDVKIERTVKKNERQPIHGNLFNQEVIVQYKMQNFKKEACTLDIEEDMNELRNEFCGGQKDREASWELLGQTTDKTKVERKSAQKVEIHIALPAGPKEADKKPDEVIFLLHVLFKNEW
ncbi:MAG: DUF4139 domain-containing protein [Planctomycetes bacterium]|nr:DUF4139 domain-containing protein [Planctomycetota bacterium]